MKSPTTLPKHQPTIADLQDHTYVDLAAPGVTVSASGRSMTVVAIVAVVGVIVLAGLMASIAERAIDHTNGTPPLQIQSAPAKANP